MSRSYKKTPCYSSKTDKFFKSYANKKLKNIDLKNGSMYKKIFCSYNICDWKCIHSEQDDLRSRTK